MTQIPFYIYYIVYTGNIRHKMQNKDKQKKNTTHEKTKKMSNMDLVIKQGSEPRCLQRVSSFCFCYYIILYL
jgi:hypothetical protein